MLNHNWQVLLDRNQSINGFLLAIRDHTELRAMEKKILEESQKLTQHRMKLEEILAGRLPLICKLLEEMQVHWAELDNQLQEMQDHGQALRRLHTWKGVSRSLGLKILSLGIHELESSLMAVKSPSAWTNQEAWHALSINLQDYASLLSTIMGTHRPLLQQATDFYAYAPIYAKELRERLQEHKLTEKGVFVLDNVPHWNIGLLSQIHEILLHAVSNAIDHGFVRPHAQGKHVNPALLQIEAEQHETSIEITMQDNGAGIDWARLQARAAELGQSQASPAMLKELMFQDGVSTADSATLSSGRGIGLSAIRSFSQSLGGQVSIDSHPAGGTILRIILPSADTKDHF